MFVCASLLLPLKLLPPPPHPKVTHQLSELLNKCSFCNCLHGCSVQILSGMRKESIAAPRAKRPAHKCTVCCLHSAGKVPQGCMNAATKRVPAWIHTHTLGHITTAKFPWERYCSENHTLLFIAEEYGPKNNPGKISYGGGRKTDI